MTLRRFEVTFRPRQEGGERGRILYVEDEDANWRITERFLRDRFDLRRARNSREALELLIREPFQLILLDIELAGSEHDGIGICRVLRGMTPMPWGLPRPEWLDEAVPIVFVTAYVSRYPREELLALGGNDVVTKPVDFTRLLLLSSRLIVSRLRDAAPARSSNPPSTTRPSPRGRGEDGKR